jgi:integrase
MALGVQIDVRHRTGCKAKGKDARRCRCSPGVRVRVAGVWVPEMAGVLPEGWVQGDLAQLESDALRFKSEVRSGRRELVVDEVPTLAAWGDDYMRETRELVAAGRLSPGTLPPYTTRWERYIKPVLGHLLLTQIDERSVEQLRETMRSGELSRRKRVVGADGSVSYEKRGLAEDSADQVVQTLAAILNKAIPRYLRVNAATQRQRGRDRRRDKQLFAPTTAREKVLAPDFARALLASTKDSDPVLHDMIWAGLHGRRRREITGMLTSELQLRAGRAPVTNQRMYGEDMPPKDGPRQAIVCPTWAKQLAVRAEHATHYVFVQGPQHENPGEPFDEFYVQKLLNAAWEAVGERPRGHSWHVLRHTFATTLRVCGVDKFVIDYLMGHDSDSTERRMPRYDVPGIYQHVLDVELRGAIHAIESVFATGGRTARVPV